jgi:hypothetical protein
MARNKPESPQSAVAPIAPNHSRNGAGSLSALKWCLAVDRRLRSACLRPDLIRGLSDSGNLVTLTLRQIPTTQVSPCVCEYIMRKVYTDAISRYKFEIYCASSSISH